MQGVSEDFLTYFVKTIFIFSDELCGEGKYKEWAHQVFYHLWRWWSCVWISYGSIVGSKEAPKTGNSVAYSHWLARKSFQPVFFFLQSNPVDTAALSCVGRFSKIRKRSKGTSFRCRHSNHNSWSSSQTLQRKWDLLFHNPSPLFRSGRCPVLSISRETSCFSTLF